MKFVNSIKCLDINFQSAFRNRQKKDDSQGSFISSYKSEPGKNGSVRKSIKIFTNLQTKIQDLFTCVSLVKFNDGV